MSKIWKTIISIIAIAVAFVTTVFITSQSPRGTEINKGYPKTEEYFVLQEKALNYAETLEINQNDKDKILVELKDDYIVVTVIRPYRCQMEATYPIIKASDGKFQIDYEKGIYESKSIFCLSCITLFFQSLSVCFLTNALTEWILYFIVFGAIKIKNKLKEKIKAKKQFKKTKTKKK